ncbi:MAG: group II truncated hemoglobin [Pseudomonadota bacterium]|nr:group II truncated hemoglobin [Pseudomonadota bacterium]
MPDTLYDALGGDPVVRRLVDRFYDHMDVLDEARTIRAMHPADLGESRDKLYWFLSGWLGGPSLYIERKGHPRLRARHLPFAVDTAARDAWMRCMDLALAEVVADPQLRAGLSEALGNVATHMQNRG